MKREVNAADWGIFPGCHEGTTKKFRELMEGLGDKTGIVLKMEPGEYHFYPESPLQKMNISNHDSCNGLAVALFMERANDFTIDGGGSSWILHKGMLPLYIKDSSGLFLKNFSVDYARPVYSQGEILEVSRQKMIIRINPEKYPWYVENNRLIFSGDDFAYAVHLCLEMDAGTHAPAYGTEDLYFCTETQRVGRHPIFTAISDDMVQIDLKGEEHFFAGSRSGNLMVFRHHPRTSPAVYAVDSKNIICENIQIHHAPGMGFLAERCENICLRKVEVFPHRETGRCFSVAADAAHFVNCSGRIHLQGCRFENQMDDGLNVHGFYAVVSKREDEYRLQLDWGHAMQRGVGLANAGDELALMRANELIPFWKGRVRKIWTGELGKMEMEVDNSLPALPEGRLVVENLTQSPEVLVEKCIFRGNRARGALLTCKKAMVDHCLFETSGAAIYLEGEAEYWYESGAFQELTFKNNRFVNCSYITEWGSAPIVACPKVKCGGNRFFHGHILLEGNEFSCFDKRLLKIRGVEEICMKNNCCIFTDTYPPKEGKRYDITDCGSFRAE